MSEHYDGSQHQEHRRAAEIHDAAAHAHLVAAEAHGKQDHPSGSERSRRALEHSQTAYLQSEAAHRASARFRHNDIAVRAHELWVARGRPEGSPDQDWHLATTQLKEAFNES